MALFHSIRLFTHFQIIVGSHDIPQWASIVGGRRRGGPELDAVP